MGLGSGKERHLLLDVAWSSRMLDVKAWAKGVVEVWVLRTEAIKPLYVSRAISAD